VLADNMAWFVKDDIARTCSRCIDTFAGREEVQKGRFLVVKAQQSKVAIAPETPKGKQLVEEFVSEQEEARRNESQQRREAEAKWLAEHRAKNKQQFIPSGQLTKSQFIEKLRSTMDRGRIDNLAVHAIFENYSFQDVFGDPDSNTQGDDLKRHLSYRCIDGSIELTVTLVETMTVLQGLNEY
jgi:hypothetical protein